MYFYFFIFIFDEDYCNENISGDDICVMVEVI